MIANGFGQVRCARFSEARTKKENPYLIMGGLVEGYLTALNQTSDQTYDLTPFENTDLLMGLIDRHCRQNPDHRFSDVVRAMAAGLVDERIVEYSEYIAFDVNDVKGRIYSETVRRMQVRLAELGHYDGPTDGRYSEATVDAMRAFQTRMGTEPTGLPDQLTLMRMFRLREQAPQ